MVIANKWINYIYHYYWARIFGEQEQEIEEYDELEKTVTVNILDYVKFKQFHDEYHTYSSYSNLYSYNKNDSLKVKKFADKHEEHFLELPKIELDIGKDRLLDWLIYFKHYNDKEVK
ncbi:Rpn family recombination-promoting nuclease/putative transposase [Thermodesulfovibrionales bacterium]|nr:Rpn family recombination-promoting nuclease/putative transposase [Thermodesulfovibrionales bacterium]MCL0086438.1 Rpn family recombination-promoting nuclease/putative transposase [Thermodesulfovibrionales bacterium]